MSKSNSKNKTPFAKEYSRTGLLNQLASEINSIIGIYSNEFKPSDFYQRVQALLRKEMSNNRVLLLWQLKGIDIRPRYALYKLGDNLLTVTATKKDISVNLGVRLHPRPGKHQADCYSYEVILLCWEGNKRPVSHSRQYSDWITLDDGLPEFEFLFPRSDAVTHWMVCLKQQLGKKSMPISAHVATAMKIAEVGTFDKKEQALLNEAISSGQAKRSSKPIEKKEPEVVRVKAKKKV